MLISIIIPTYNNNIKLARLLKSIPVINSFQVIVVDDFGREPCNILKPEFPHVDFFINQRGKGAGGARNTGLEKAKGKYVLFADSDDVFDSNSLIELLNHDCSSDIIYYPPTSFLESNVRLIGTRHNKYKKLVEYYNVNNKLLNFQFYVPWSKLLKLEIIRNNNIWFDEVMYSNDICFSLKVGIIAKKIKISDLVIYKVEQGSESLTKSISKESILCRINSLERYNNILIDNGYSKYQVMVMPLLIKLFFINKMCFSSELFKKIKSKQPVILDFRTKCFFIKYILTERIC